MKYTEYRFEISPIEPWREILIAYLGELPFESFIDTDNGLLAYIKTNDDLNDLLKELPILNSEELEITYEKSEAPDINWNEEWEKKITPINVENQIYVHTEFHPKEENIPYPIIIEPKMSFGTGHHETTYTMLHAMLSIDFSHKQVLDMGCGTAILGIFAKKKGADYVEAIDIDPWAYENSLENAVKNNVDMTVKLGDASTISNQRFDVILANINKNILLQDVKNYVEHLQPQGNLLVSGIYDYDYDDIIAESKKYGLKFVQKWSKNNWISILLQYDL